jgi:hypothetical protein
MSSLTKRSLFRGSGRVKEGLGNGNAAKKKSRGIEREDASAASMMSFNGLRR